VRYALVASLSLASLVLSCHRREWPGPTQEAQAPSAAPIAAPPPADDALPVVAIPPGGHPRIVLTTERLQGAARAALAGSGAWKRLQHDCVEYGDGKGESGYQGETWGIAALDLALCARVKHDDAAAKAAVAYLMALVDDDEKVGDKKGGLPAVKTNDGYPIRYRGFFAAMAYDWLFDRLTPEQRKHLADRFVDFCHWYRKEGYKTDDPIANHYMGYFGACAMGGLALEGDDPRGEELRQIARVMWSTQIVPAYRRLPGGDFPEGWQYARMPVAALAFYVDGEGRASKGGKALLDALPWLRATVAFQTHALLPDGVHFWDEADWSKKPARLAPEMLYAATLALPEGDDAARRALFLARQLAAGERDLEWNWLDVVADDPARAATDPRTGATSYEAPGTGTVFARTAWSKDAVWVAMNSGPPWGDHQHLDQGHFEIARGPDLLAIDPGDYDSYSTMSHNTILVDDDHENMRWTPNQGIWGKTATTARFEDANGVAYAEADFGAAYNPDGYPDDHAQRSVLRAERELVFSRSPLQGARGASARVVLYDRVTLAKPDYGATWTVHASSAPAVDGARTRVRVGGSGLVVTTLEPQGAKATVVREPTVKSEDMFTKNDPAEGITSFRVEVASPRGNIERRWLHVIAVGAAGDAPPDSVRIAGEGAAGTALDGEAYVFPTAGPQGAGGHGASPLSWREPAAVARVVVTGLAPNGRYAWSSARDGDACKIALRPDGDLVASAAGVAVVALHDCAR
jgi:hypothetical protein